MCHDKYMSCQRVFICHRFILCDIVEVTYTIIQSQLKISILRIFSASQVDIFVSFISTCLRAKAWADFFSIWGDERLCFHQCALPWCRSAASAVEFFLTLPSLSSITSRPGLSVFLYRWYPAKKGWKRVKKCMFVGLCLHTGSRHPARLSSHFLKARVQSLQTPQNILLDLWFVQIISLILEKQKEEKLLTNTQTKLCILSGCSCVSTFLSLLNADSFSSVCQTRTCQSRFKFIFGSCSHQMQTDGRVHHKSTRAHDQQTICHNVSCKEKVMPARTPLV